MKLAVEVGVLVPEVSEKKAFATRKQSSNEAEGLCSHFPDALFIN